MNINDLLNVVSLYKSSEKNTKMRFQVKKIDDENLNFSISLDSKEHTDLVLPAKIVFENNNFIEIIKQLKENFIVIDEKYEVDEVNKMCIYNITLNNGRQLAFINFSLVAVNNIRNILYDIKYEIDEIRVNTESTMLVNQRFSLGTLGFSEYATIFLITLWFLDIFMISLWIFKAFI